MTLFKGHVRPSPLGLDGRTTPVPRYRAARYAAQRRTGIAGLTFFPEIEEEFLQAFVARNAFRIRWANLLSLAAILCFMALDTFLGMNLQPPAADLILLCVTVPAVLLPILATFHPRINRHVPTLLFVSGIAVGVSVAFVVYLGRVANPVWFPYESLILVTMYLYFVSGMLFRHAVVAGLITLMVFMATNWRIVEQPILLYEGYYLLVANAIGALGIYVLEYELRKLFLAERELRQHAGQDPLTGAMNRRAFQAYMARAWREALRQQVNLGVLLVDLDNFKQLNDRNGHAFGDDALCSVVEVLQSNAQRPLDGVARYGGDEFVAVWYDIERDWFLGLIDELPVHVRHLAFRSDPADTSVTISGGAVLVHPDPGLTIEDVIRKADALMYGVKRNGGNGITLASLGRDPRAKTPVAAPARAA